jgi:1-acyl-sn-glycerol-3-phosphate acyltransferase
VSISHRLVVGLAKGLTGLLCRIDDQELQRLPDKGPLIIYTNHVNVLELPIIYTHLQPRKVHGMLLAERWKIPVLNWFLDITETIPLHRATADIDAIRLGLEALQRGEMLIIAPEGTRSHSGRLQLGHPGVVLLALHSGAPLIPVGYYGGESYTDNLKRLKRTEFHIRVGQPFQLKAGVEKVTHGLRKQMVEEMMYRLAEVLPAEYRGVYADLSNSRARYIDYKDLTTKVAKDTK